MLAQVEKTARNKILNKLNKKAYPKFSKTHASPEEVSKWLNK